MMDVRFFSTISQEVLLMQQQALRQLLQDLEQELLRLGYTKGTMTFYRNRWRKLEESADEADEPFIFDGFAQDGEQQLMRERVEALRYIALDEPDAARPVLIDFPQGCMASPLWSEPMRVGAKLRFQVSVENETNNL